MLRVICEFKSASRLIHASRCAVYAAEKYLPGAVAGLVGRSVRVVRRCASGRPSYESAFIESIENHPPIVITVPAHTTTCAVIRQKIARILGVQPSRLVLRFDGTSTLTPLDYSVYQIYTDFIGDYETYVDPQTGVPCANEYELYITYDLVLS